MINNFFSFYSFLSHWLKKVDGYSLQSPFVFQVYQDLQNYLKTQISSNQQIEAVRKYLLSSSQNIKVLDLGAGSKKVNTHQRKVSDITRYSTSSKKYALLYQYFCQLTPANQVIELGTCMGITTQYLSKVTKGHLYTFEGSEEILQIARSTAQLTNASYILGDISTKLPEILSTLDQIDFALIDANHTYYGATNYFGLLLEKIHKDSIIAIGDIYWSKEMNKAWDEIKSHPQVFLSLDFFECGIVFFNPKLKKDHFTLGI
ncbi:Methyltransferase domain-containing protein [Algoriphagus halophilus]|uniref:Methyltransferase domain-containing protein n=1 Tax=Algoriphagus halophilus TaxID=226505 RepID=A0A1N6HDK2_9BACT|nr:Methyltransferase domain-containing protein [Algoriphagus halophilus]